MLATLKPLHALLLADSPLLTLVFLSVFLLWAHPGLHTQHAKWQAVGRDGQQAVHQEAALVTARAIAQPLCCRQMREIEFCRVLRGQDDRYLLHAAQRLVNM
jgi:hypothetical protein